MIYSFFFSVSARAKHEYHRKIEAIAGLTCEHLTEASRIRSENILVIQRAYPPLAVDVIEMFVAEHHRGRAEM